MRSFLKLVIVLWIIIAFFNVFYNMKKTFSEVHEWGSLSIDEKRYKIFGDLYDFSLLLNKYTESDAKILMSSTDGMMYGVGRYYVYPRSLICPPEEKLFIARAKEKKITYIFIYNKMGSFEGYEKIASFSSKKSNNYAILYKLK